MLFRSQAGGSLICLGLDDGRERWRLPIAAPDPRYTSPVVADGKVFFAAEGLLCARAVADVKEPLFDGCMRANGGLMDRAAARKDLGIDELERSADGRTQAEQVWQKEVVKSGPLKCVTPALCDGKLYVRTGSRIVCYDMASQTTSLRWPPHGSGSSLTVAGLGLNNHDMRIMEMVLMTSFQGDDPCDRR